MNTPQLLRVAKMGVAVLLICFSLWALLLPPFFPSSSNAVVNTRKIDIEAPVSGLITRIPVSARETVKKGQVLATISPDLAVKQQEIDELTFTKKRLETQIANTNQRLENLRASLKETEAEFLERQQRTVANLRTELSGIEESIGILRKELQILEEDELRVRDLLESGIITQARWSEVNRRVVEAAGRLQNELNRRNRINKDLETALGGLARSSDQAVSTTSPEMAITTLQYEIRTLEGELSNHHLELTETNRLIESAESFLTQSQERDVISPMDGLIWIKQSVEGQTIATGQTLVQVADANSVFVEAFFHRFYEETLSPGDIAFINLNGMVEHVQGEVLDIQVQEHGSADVNVINSVAPSSSMLRVIIQVEGDVLTPELVGRLGRTVVTSGQPGFINRTLVWLSLKLRNS